MNQYPRKCAVADNSGAMVIKCLKILKKGPKACLQAGDIIVGVVSRLRKSQRIRRVKKGDIVKCLVVTVSTPRRLYDGVLVRNTGTSVVLLNNQDNLLGTRIMSYVSEELKYTRFNRLISVSLGIL